MKTTQPPTQESSRRPTSYKGGDCYDYIAKARRNMLNHTGRAWRPNGVLLRPVYEIFNGWRFCDYQIVAPLTPSRC